MALQSEVSPTIVGDPNKDTQIDGDTKSDENHSSQSTDEDADLEDGEILESEAEEEKDFSNVSLKEALDKSCLQSIELLVNKAKEAKNVASPDRSKIISPRKMKRMADNYMDHDRTEHSSDHEKGWVPSSPKCKSKFGDKPIDYRMELAAYRGTPPSSPDRKRRDDKLKKKRSSKKPKKSKKAIRRKDAKGQRVASFKRDAAKGKICRFYKEGKCAKGSSCYFSHSSPSFKKRELCKFYLNGHCNKGKDCLYMHGEFPCKFYHTGSECYAKNDCRFSHTPLTEEMKKLLADYLRSCHGDDMRHNRSDDRDRDHNDRDREHSNRDREHSNRERKRPASPELQPPPAKRTCLLGSPPRHIREAEETRRWQDEMKMLQEQNHPSFEICWSPGGTNVLPMEFQKPPSFYQETLLNTPSPKRRPPNMEPINSFLHSNADNYEEGSPSKVYIYDEDDFVEIDMSAVKQKPPEEYHWENDHEMRSPEQEDVKPFIETPHQEQDFTSDIKFDETTQFSEMESSTDCAQAQSPDSANQAPSEEASNLEDKQQQDDSTPPIVVPTHLPRIQQELFMRVQKHQRLNAVNVGGSPNNNDGEDVQVKKEIDSDAEEKSVVGTKDGEWYTSEEEEDEDDPPLTDVLKKIQQDPPLKPQPPEAKPKVDLLAIFNTIQQKTKEKNKGLTEVQQKHSSFWQNILGGVSASKAAAATTTAPVSNPVAIEQPKRRTLLPDPIIKVELPTSPAEPPTIKDPRLKNRDPRKLAREAKLNVDIPKPTCIDSSPSIQEVCSLPVKPTVSEQGKESIPYRLRGIVAKPLNYTPYLHASQSNPSLLKDPRLRKHLKSSDPVNGNEKDHDVVKLPVPPKDAPPIPELLLKYEKPVAAINIFESSSSNKPDAKPSIPVTIPVSYDPVDSKSRAPVPVAYDPPDLKSQVPIPYDPVESKRSIPALVSYDPIDSKSRGPVPVSYDPVDSKRSVPVPVSYDPVDSKRSVPVPVSYDPVDSKRSVPIPVSYCPVDSKRSLPTPVSYDLVDSKSSIPASCSSPEDSKSRTNFQVTNDPVGSNSSTHLPVPAMKSHVPIPVAITRGPVSLKSRAPLSTSRKDPRSKRRDSIASNSSSDTPPHLTIVDTIPTPDSEESKPAPILVNELMETDEKKQSPPVIEKKASPPPCLDKNLRTNIKKEVESSAGSNVTLKKNLADIKKDVESAAGSNVTLKKNLADIKKEDESAAGSNVTLKKNLADIKKDDEDSDSDSNMDVPLILLSGKSSYKKSPSPPIVEEFMTVIKKEVSQVVTGDSKPVVPPLIIKKVKPSLTPASHLPRAIADPRMAKLHNPRRPRIAASDATPPKRVSERRKQPLTEVAKPANKDTEDDSIPTKSEVTKLTKATRDAKAEEKPKAAKSIPKKRRLSDKSEEKKKTVHRNRKSSMDYASPLNSCDATDNTKSSSYNRYNQRPKRGVNAPLTAKVSQVEVPSQSDSNSIPEFALSDSSNLECDNSSDVNLKDRFKTIDPTASPFC